MASSQGIPEDIKQQLAGKEEEKKRAKQKSDELVVKRERLETELRTAKPEERADIQASIDRIEGDIADARKDVHDLNEQIKALLGKKKKKKEEKVRNLIE